MHNIAEILKRVYQHMMDPVMFQNVRCMFSYDAIRAKHLDVTINFRT